MSAMEKWGTPEERNKIARQIKNARRSERTDSGIRQILSFTSEPPYALDRSGKEYVYRMGGMEHFFEYLTTLPNKRILDIGAGTGGASLMVSDLAEKFGLSLEITALRNSPTLEKNFPKEKTHLTPMETLKGIKPESLAGIVALNSLMYTTAPELTAKKLEQVLVPGGVIKATFIQEGKKEVYDRKLEASDAEALGRALLALGFDVAVKSKFSAYTEAGTLMTNSIMLAIKPGNPAAPKATELMRQDFHQIKKEAIDEQDGRMVFDTRD